MRTGDKSQLAANARLRRPRGGGWIWVMGAIWLLPLGVGAAESTLAWWTFDEGSGSVVQDTSGNGNDGTIHGATWVPRETGSALRFTGQPADYVIIPHRPELAIVAPFYVEAWIRARGTNHYGAIVDKHRLLNAESASGFTLYLTGGQLRFGTYCGVQGNSDVFAPGELRDDTWHHVMGGWDGDSVYVYVDGEFAAEAAWPHAPVLSNTALGIGKRLDGWGGTLSFEGEIDGVRIWGSRFEGANVAGRVDELDLGGRVRGPLAGCAIALDGNVLGTTDARGEFLLPTVSSGDHEILVSHAGYYAVTRSVAVAADESRFESFQLAAESDGSDPVVFDLRWPPGRYYLAGLPGTFDLGCTVAWNGSLGSVKYLLGESSHAATLHDLGNGLARAALEDLDIPDTLAAPVELVLEATNGEGHQTTIAPGLYVHPLPRLLVLWFGASPAWAIADPRFDYSESISLTFWDAKVPGGIYESSAALGLARSLSLDTLGGTATGSLSGFGAFSHSMDVPGVPVEVLGEGRLDLAGTVDLTFQGLSPLVMTPSWSASFLGKAGIGVPVVVVVNVVAPGLGSTLSEIPGLGDVKLRLYEIGGLGLAGKYAGGKTGECFLGTTALTFSGTLGLEAQLVLDLDELDVEAGVYVGATGTPEFQICPGLAFEGITFRGYAGVFASAWIFEIEKEVGVEVRFEPGAGLARNGRAMTSAPLASGPWKAIGARQRLWGPADRAPLTAAARVGRSVGLAGPGPEATATVRENVSQLARPTLWVMDQEIGLLYVTHDPTKPWHASTDLAVAKPEAGGDWSVNGLTNDEAAEFRPAVAGTSWGLVAAWERVQGDASGLTRPDQIAPLLDIVACFYDSQAKLWTEPMALTANQRVDREPVPLAWANGAGVLWIQNEGRSPLGSLSSGDRVCFASTDNAGGWQEPVILWEGPKGVVDLAAMADPDGALYAAWIVDEDGDPVTREDRELHACSAFGRTWGVPVQLTDDAVEDADPRVAALGRTPLFVWQSGGALTYALGGRWDPRRVHGTGTADAEVAPTLVAIPGGAALVYPQAGSAGVDIVVCTYDAAADQWSAPRPLTADADVEHSITAVHDGSRLVLAGLRTQTIRTEKAVEFAGQTVVLSDLAQAGRTDLCVWQHVLGLDPAVREGSLRLDPPNPSSGATSVIEVVVENRGELAVQDLEIGFFDGDPDSGGAAIGPAAVHAAHLEAGTTRSVSASWVVPGGDVGHQIFARVDPNRRSEDRDRSNNTASIRTRLPDWIIESASATTVGVNQVLLVARVRNGGAIAAPKSAVTWRSGSEAGSIIAHQPLPRLKAGGSVEVTWLWEPPPEAVSASWVVVVVDVDDSETVVESDESNNRRRLVARSLAPWVPQVSRIRWADGDRIALEITAPHAVPSELVVEKADTMGEVVLWEVDGTATITRTTPTVFEATLARPERVRFFRVRLTPRSSP